VQQSEVEVLKQAEPVIELALLQEFPSSRSHPL
jgi:hypothetical protein